MQLPTTTTIAILVGAVIFIALLYFLRRPSTRRSPYRGPNNLHFVCRGCQGQFTHTKRTVAAWERGSRKFFCDSCHRTWRQANPGAPAKQSAPREAQRQSLPHGRATARGGCLSVVVAAAVLPLLLYAAVRYA